MQLEKKRRLSMLVCLVLLALLLLPRGVAVPTHVSAQTRVVKDAGRCGVDPTKDVDRPYQIRDIVDGLPTVDPGRHVSDPFFLLASEVSYREEAKLPITEAALVEACTEDFNPESGGIAYNLPALTHGNNWETILQAYSDRYGKDYPAIAGALETFKAQAIAYAKEHGLPVSDEATPTPTPTETPTPTPAGSSSIGGTPQAEPFLEVTAISDREATIHAKNAFAENILVRNMSHDIASCTSFLLQSNDETVTVHDLQPDTDYEFRLKDQEVVEKTEEGPELQAKKAQLNRDKFAVLGTMLGAGALTALGMATGTGFVIPVTAFAVSHLLDYYAEHDPAMKKWYDALKAGTDTISMMGSVNDAVESAFVAPKVRDWLNGPFLQKVFKSPLGEKLGLSEFVKDELEKGAKKGLDKGINGDVNILAEKVRDVAEEQLEKVDNDYEELAEPQAPIPSCKFD